MNFRTSWLTMSISSPSTTRSSETVSSRTSSPAMIDRGNTCTPRRSTSESGDGKPYRCAPLMVANKRG